MPDLLEAEIRVTPSTLESLLQQFAPRFPFLQQVKSIGAEPGGPLVFTPEFVGGWKTRLTLTIKPDGT